MPAGPHAAPLPWRPRAPEPDSDGQIKTTITRGVGGLGGAGVSMPTRPRPLLPRLFSAVGVGPGPPSLWTRASYFSGSRLKPDTPPPPKKRGGGSVIYISNHFNEPELM